MAVKTQAQDVLFVILAFVMVLGLLPATALATEAEYVYISVSYDGKYINDKDGGYIAYIPVSLDTLAEVNLDDYGLSDYWYDEDGGTFYGESNGFKFEWTIFGSDIAEPKEVNLLVELSETDDGNIKAALSQEQPFGFSALLSVYLGEKWEAQSATAYQNDKAVASVSLTGSKNTILNISVNEIVGELVIHPDAIIEDVVPGDTTAPDDSTTESTGATTGNDDYLSDAKESDNRVYSDGKGTGQDQYLTDPIPEGKPMPVEPENQDVDKTKTYTCTFSIECSTILNNLDMLDPEKLEMVPSNGVILAKTTVTFYEGESVYDVLQRVCKDYGIHMEASWTPIYNSAYVEGIHNLYEFDCGNLSGWMYRVNGWYPNYGCSRYQLQQGDVVEWRYTCDLGEDVGRSGSW